MQDAPPLENRHAFITGGATGIGLAISRQLAAAGAHVTIASRNADRVKKAAANIDGASAVVLDVADPDSVSAAFESVGAVDILVNNAGIAHAAPINKTTLEQWQQIIAVNLTGVFLCTQAVLESMLKRDAGRIVNIASTAGLTGYAYTSSYSAAKHGVVGLTRSLALELADTDITINSVCPGFTDTDIVADAVANIAHKTGRTDADALAELLRNNPQNRLVTPEEVAHTVLWLCQPSSRSITGQAIAVAGGEVM